jgi:hypothetical protein
MKQKKYSDTKVNYVSRAHQLTQDNYLVIISTKNVKNYLTQDYIDKAIKSNIKVIHLRSKLLRVVSKPLVKLTQAKENQEGQLVLYHKDYHVLSEFLKTNVISQKVYLKQNQVSDQKVEIKKGPTKIKAGATLPILEAIGNIKLTKGNVEFLEDAILVDKNKRLTQTASKAMKILRIRTKITKIEPLGVFYVKNTNEGVEVEQKATEILDHLNNPDQSVNNVQKVLNSLDKSYKFNFNAAQKITNLIYAIERINTN